MLIAAVNACFAGICSPLLRSRRLSVSIIGVVLVVILTLAYGEWRLTQTFTTGEPVTVAVVQGAIERQFRFDPEHRQVNLERYLTLTKQVATSSPSLILWPENAVDFYMQEAVPEREAILKVTRDLGVNLLLGGPYYGYGAEDRYYHNSVFLIRSGKLAGRYDKVRLLPFAETDRFGELFPEKQLNLTPGQRLQTLRMGNIRVGAFVCFEAMYPDFVRRFAQQGAEMLVNPSNDDWFNYIAPAQHQLDIATVRAIENRRYLIRPTTVGFSAIIDPYGRTVARSGFGAPEVLTASIYASRAQTPYQRWGDAVVWGAVIIVAVVSLMTFIGLCKNDKGGVL
jgi:apolipoprotein N-acyltransferase